MDFLNESDNNMLSQALDLYETFEQTSEEDVLLSQTLETIETSDLFLDLLTKSQMSSASTEVQLHEYGDFDIDKNEPTAEPTEVESKQRFASSVSTSELDELVKNQRPKNTERSTKWAFNAVEAWRTAKNDAGDDIPDLAQIDINTHLSRFVVEVRKQNGECFPSESLYSLVCGLLRKLRSYGINYKNFLDESDHSFSRFRSVLDAQMKNLTQQGISGVKREAEPVSLEDEALLWQTSVFGNNNATELQHTVFFYNCKLFGLRGFDEHRDLECNQFEFGTDNEGKYVIYKGKSCKTYKGGLKQRKIEPKIIKHYNNEQNIVEYFQQYITAIGEGVFYRRPLPAKTLGDIRFSHQVVGANKLKTFMKDMCKKAGLEKRYTNHSGKKTCATTLYQNDVPEQEIMQRTAIGRFSA